MQRDKNRYKSKTVIAWITLLIVALKQLFDIEIGLWEVEIVLEQATLLISSILAIYWRVVATARLK